MPSCAASAGAISTQRSAGASWRSTGDFAVRVWVCHWLELPRPVSSTNGVQEPVDQGLDLGAALSRGCHRRADGGRPP
jgi:hypothetical protein